MTDPTRAALEQAANELDIAENALLCSSFHNAASRAKQAARAARAAIAADRAQAQPEPASLSDEELLELMPQQFRDDLATVSRMAAYGAGTGVTPGVFRVSLNTGALEFARAVEAATLARAQRQPVPPQPVPVSERLPGPEDCDGEHYCWRWNTIGCLWARQPLARSWYEFESHWLPANALPPPGEVEHG